MVQDAMTRINEMDAKTVQMFIDRLEGRGRDATFVGYREAYLDRLNLAQAQTVLDIGCGTGIVARAVAQRGEFGGRILGVDQSPALIEAGRRLAVAEGVDGRINFRVADVHSLDVPDGSVDAVVAHTLISHVLDPLLILRESRRVLRPGGVLAVFDGDYATWAFGCEDHALARAMEDGILTVVVHNPRIMRDMPRLLRRAGFEMLDVTAYVYVDVGTGGFFVATVEGYGPMIARGGLVPPIDVDRWLTEQRAAMVDGTFFAACNYYTYLARPTP